MPWHVQLGHSLVHYINKLFVLPDIRRLTTNKCQQGFEATRQFVRSHFFSRQADIASILKFEDPKAILSATTRKYQLGHPEARSVILFFSPS